MQQFEFRSGADYKGFPIIVREEDLSIHCHWRSGKSFPLRNAEASLKHDFSGHGFNTGDDACHVIHHVQILTVQNWRRNEWRTFGTCPCDVSLRYVATSSRTYG